MAAAAGLALKPAAQCRWDLVALGEVLLRLDPGTASIHEARSFRAWEGGGEYNVARNLAHCFGRRTAIVTALADNPIGRLVEDLIREGGVDRSHIRWVPYDGIGRAARNGMYFADRGFGARAVACSDRAHTAVSQLAPGAIDWDAVFAREGARWFHTGGVFCGLSATTPQVAREAMMAARRCGTVVSYDLNYRESLWRARGGKAAADAVNATLAPLADVLFGAGPQLERVAAEFPNLAIVATTLWSEARPGVCQWSAACRAGGAELRAPMREVAVLDRIGAGDAFGAGFIQALLDGKDPQAALDCGAALGAHTMTTAGDSATAAAPDVEAVVRRMAGTAAP